MSQRRKSRKALKGFAKAVAILGATALAAFLWAAPVAADGHISLSVSPSTVPAEAGDVTITVSGSGFSGNLNPFFVTTCPGAEGDPAALATIAEAGGDASALLASATAICPTILGDGASPEWSDGSFSHEMTISISDADISNGSLVVLAAGLSGTTPEFAFTSLAISDGEEPAEPVLAETGANSGLLAIIGISVLGAGLLVIAQSRRLRAVN